VVNEEYKGKQAYLVNVDKDDGLDRLVLEDLSDDTSVSSSNDENVLGVRMRGHGDVSDHLLVASRREQKQVSGSSCSSFRACDPSSERAPQFTIRRVHQQRFQAVRLQTCAQLWLSCWL
jgi:hypothetical protein